MIGIKALASKLKAAAGRETGAREAGSTFPAQSSRDEKLAEARSKIAEKNQRLRRARQKLAKKEQEIAELRAELASAERARQLPKSLNGHFRNQVDITLAHR